MTPVGFEPTQLALVELESTPLDHSGKVSMSHRGSRAIAPFLLVVFADRDLATERQSFSEMLFSRSGVAQWLACWAHNPKIRGSKPRSAICYYSVIAFAHNLRGALTLDARLL